MQQRRDSKHITLKSRRSIFYHIVIKIDSESFGLVFNISLTALAASIGAPSAPGTGIVILSTILIAAGIPPVGIILLLGVDRILDMTRTMVNVTGDLTACMFFDRRARKKNLEEKSIASEG